MKISACRVDFVNVQSRNWLSQSIIRHRTPQTPHTPHKHHPQPNHPPSPLPAPLPAAAPPPASFGLISAQPRPCSKVRGEWGGWGVFSGNQKSMSEESMSESSATKPDQKPVASRHSRLHATLRRAAPPCTGLLLPLFSGPFECHLAAAQPKT